jgi:hypothetical protein
MEGGTPVVTADIEELRGNMILDTGSDVSLLQPGLVDGITETSHLKPYGVTGETLAVKGQQTVSFTIGGRKFRHTFLKCPLPTQASGLLGTDFLMKFRRKLILTRERCRGRLKKKERQTRRQSQV